MEKTSERRKLRGQTPAARYDDLESQYLRLEFEGRLTPDQEQWFDDVLADLWRELSRDERQRVRQRIAMAKAASVRELSEVVVGPENPSLPHPEFPGEEATA